MHDGLTLCSKGLRKLRDIGRRIGLVLGPINFLAHFLLKFSQFSPVPLSPVSPLNFCKCCYDSLFLLADIAGRYKRDNKSNEIFYLCIFCAA